MSYYLLDNQNGHAPKRSDGRRFWGHPTRQSPLRLLVLHTGENLPDFTPPDRGAENIAAYLSTTSRAASYHEVVDSDTYVPLLPPNYTAFGAMNYNSMAYHLSAATQAHRWGSKPDWWEDAIIKLMAKRAAIQVKNHNLPVRLLTKAQVDAGARGITTHSRLDPSRRSDPGPNFPMVKFFTLIEEELRMPNKPDFEVAIVVENDIDEGIAQPLRVKYVWKVLRYPHTGITVGHAILLGQSKRRAGEYPKHTILAGGDRRETGAAVLHKIEANNRTP